MKKIFFSILRIIIFSIISAGMVLSLLFYFIYNPLIFHSYPLLCALIIALIPLFIMGSICYFTHLRKIINNTKRFKTNLQKTVERGLYFQEKRRVNEAIKQGFFDKSELSHKIKFPITGLKNEVKTIFNFYEDTSYLITEDFSKWIFYDANFYLVVPQLIPPLIGWRRKVRQHFIGKYFLELPIDGWVCFILKRPVEKLNINLSEVNNHG